MKERVEVSRKIEKKSRERRRSRRRKATTSVPRDIISEILSKLPLRSVVRFRCVSKLWSSITNESLQTTRRSRLLVVGFRKANGFFVLSIPQEKLQNPNESFDAFTYNSYSCSQPIDSYRMTHLNQQRLFTIETESIHGLMVCFLIRRRPIVWNPTIRKLLPLPKPFETWLVEVRIFLGYDPIEGKHKVVCMPYLRRDQDLYECKVLTLGSGSAQEPWRKVETTPNHYPLTEGNINTGYSHARCINGVVYYHAKLGPHPHTRVMMSFDVRSEKFRVITLPPGYKSWRRTISYHGKLACVGYDNHGKTISMFVLEDATKDEWSRHQFSSLPEHCPDLNHFDLMTGTDDDGGELIYVGAKSLEIIYIDLKRKTFRRVNYRGILDDFRQRNELVEDSPLADLDAFQFFPNHIETLASL